MTGSDFIIAINRAELDGLVHFAATLRSIYEREFAPSRLAERAPDDSRASLDLLTPGDTPPARPAHL